MIEPGPVVPQLPDASSAPVPGQGTGSDPLPTDILDDNVRGRPRTPPEAGFGKLWRKRYWIRLPEVDLTPEDLIQFWRSEFGHIWPKGNAFYRPVEGLEVGEVALFDLSLPLGGRVSTGVVVVDVQPASFAFQTTRGHTFAGSITFSAKIDDGVLVAQVESEIRASDPIYELGLPLGGHDREDQFWLQTLRNLAAHLGATAEPEKTMTELDAHRRWRNAGNIRDNAVLHTAARMVARPFRFALARFGAKGGLS